MADTTPEEAGGTILVVGALHHDFVLRAPHLPAPDETVMGHGLETVCGGKGGNQAAAAARLGARVHFAGRVGKDQPGRTLRRNLEKAGVDTAALQTDAKAPSGMSVAIVEDSGDYAAVVVTGANAAIDSAEFALPPDCALLVLQSEVPEVACRAAAERAREASVPVLWNAAPFSREHRDILDLVDILVVNRGEAEAMFAVGLDTPRAVEDLLLSTAVTCPTIVTLGAGGAMLGGPRRAPAHVPAVAVDVVSSHGAGDVFVGALAARIATGAALDEAAPYAAHAAAVWVSSDNAARAKFGREAVIESQVAQSA